MNPLIHSKPDSSDRKVQQTFLHYLLTGWTGLLCMLFAVLFYMSACTQERQPCLTPKIASLNIQCVHFHDTAVTTKDTALPKAIWGSVTDSGTQLVLYKNPSAYFTISLSPRADSCKWLVTTDSLNNAFDTVSFYYTRKLQFLSNACGYTYFYSLNSLYTTHHNIDSILITNPSVTNDVNTKQLKVFIHPAS